MDKVDMSGDSFEEIRSWMNKKTLQSYQWTTSTDSNSSAKVWRPERIDFGTYNVTRKAKNKKSTALTAEAKYAIKNSKIVWIGDDHKQHGLKKSLWTSPFNHIKATATFRTTSAAESVEKYKEWLVTHPELLARINEDLRGKALLCSCTWRQPCHGDVLIQMANQGTPGQVSKVAQLELTEGAKELIHKLLTGDIILTHVKQGYVAATGRYTYTVELEATLRPKPLK